MRNEIEPDWETAEKIYPAIKALIEEYTEYCDENGDEELAEYKKLKNRLSEITKKDISYYKLWEWWEGEGLEVLSFRISLPEPNIAQDISKEELMEIVRRINVSIQQDNKNSFRNAFSCYLEDYYHKLLKRNFKKYKYAYFNRQKDNAGNYFEHSTEEIAEKIWSK
jgi:predicted AlkP superfamily pyrophosphatase or phosphodiesterase